MPLPAIVHWDGNHWVVLYDVDEKPRPGLRPGDRPAPAHPRRVRREVERLRRAVRLHRPRSRRTRRPSSGSRWLLPFFRPHRACSSRPPALALIVSVLQMVIPVFTQVIVDRVLVEHDVGLLNILIVGMVGGRRLHPGRHGHPALPAELHRGPHRLGHARLPHPPAAQPADELLQHPAHRRHPAPARRASGRCASSWWSTASPGSPQWRSCVAALGADGWSTARC